MMPISKRDPADGSRASQTTLPVARPQGATGAASKRWYQHRNRVHRAHNGAHGASGRINPSGRQASRAGQFRAHRPGGSPGFSVRRVARPQGATGTTSRQGKSVPGFARHRAHNGLWRASGTHPFRARSVSVRIVREYSPVYSVRSVAHPRAPVSMPAGKVT